MNEELPQYPASLPQYPLRKPLRIQPEDNVARSPTDTGPGKQRPRSRLEVIRVRCSTKLPTRAALEELLKFHRETLAQGSKRFAWTGLTDNIPNGTYQALQFAAKPAWQPAGATAYRVDMELLALPADPGIWLVRAEWISAFLNFTRSSEKWVWNADGVLEKIGVDELPWNYDLAIGVLWALIEEQRTNSLLTNRNVNSGDWTNTVTRTQNETGIDGVANKAWTLTDGSTTAAQYTQQSISIPDDSETHVQSVYIKKDEDETRFPFFQINLTGGTTSISKGVTLNTKTGAIGRDIDAADIEDAGDWWRLSVKATNNNTGNATLRLNLYPARGITLETLSNEGMGSCIYDFGQIELNASVATSPIETGASAVTRSADQLNRPLGGEFNNDHLTLVMHGVAPILGGDNQFLFDYSDGSSNNRLRVFRKSSDSRLFIEVRKDGGNLVLRTTPVTLSDGQKFKLAFRVDKGASDEYTLAFNGTIEEVESGDVPTVTNLDIGQNHAGIEQFGGHIGPVREFFRALTDSELQRETAL